MGDVFDQINPGSTQAPKPDQPNQSVANAPNSQSGDVFEQINPNNQMAAKPQTTTENAPEERGTLEKAWDWANQPMADPLLKKVGTSTSDVFKAAAFQKMFGESYIPGVNDFDTKAEQHLNESGAKHAAKTFMTGAAKDTAEMAAGFTSPVQAALTAVGLGEEGAVGKTAAKIAKPVAVAAGTAFAGMGGKQAYEALRKAMDEGKLTPENVKDFFTGLAMSAGGAAGAGKGLTSEIPTHPPTPAAPVVEPTPAPETGSVAGPRTTLRPTTVKTAGVEAPISALQQEDAPLAARAAAKLTTPGAASEFQKAQTVPAATKQMVSTVGQVAEDRIAQHNAIMNGEETPATIAGTQTPSKYSSIDDIRSATAETARKTYAKADDISKNDLAQWQAKVNDAHADAHAQIDEYNKNVDEHNANISTVLGPDGQEIPTAAPLPRQPFDSSKVSVPDRPATYSELKADLDKAKAESASTDAAIREDAYNNGIPKAEKALDNWFKQHDDIISPSEYTSAKRLYADSERYGDIANGLRSAMNKGAVTGNTMRGLEATIDNKMIRRGQAPGAFKRLLGDDGYDNWKSVSKLFDPVKGAPQGIKAWGSYALEYMVAHLLGPWGLAGKAGSEFLLNRIMFNSSWGNWFGRATNVLKELATREHGAAGAPGTIGQPFGEPTGAKVDLTDDLHDEFHDLMKRDTVGSQEGADQDTQHFQNARAELGADASFSDVAARAQKMKAAANTPDFNFVKDADGKPSRLEIMKSGEPIGHLHVEEEIPGTWTVKDAVVKEGETGKGYGRAAYKQLFEEAKKEGIRTVESDISNTSKAAGVWKALEKEFPGQVTEDNGQYSINLERRAGDRNPTMSATELEDAMKNRKSIQTPFDVTEGAMDTINRDINARVVSPDHMAQAAAHEQNGGSTFNPRLGDMAGKPYTAVAGSHPELSKTVDGTKITPEQIRAYMADPAVAKVLRENPDASIGTWAHDGKTDLEISHTLADRDAAIELGKKNNQISVFDLKNFEEIPTGGTGTREVEQPSGRVGQRRPSAANVETGHDPSRNLDMDTVMKAGQEKPDYLRKLAEKVSDTQGMKFEPEGDAAEFNPDELTTADPKKIIKSFVKQAADNIEWLHDQVPESIRTMSKNWYDSANTMTAQQAQDYGISHPQAAAVTAVLSPQNPWDNNISLANRVLDVWKNKQNFKWSPEMNKKAAELYGQSPAIAKFTDMVRGKRLGQLKNADPETQLAMKAMWTRIYDEAHNPRTFERWAPDGSTRGIARTENGTPANSSWFSLLPISKALSVLEDGSMDNIHEQLGGNHKVRNFYNNIIDPNAKMGDTTVDTHAVGVAHLSPFSLNDKEVTQNFSGTKNAKHGLVGTYPLYAEAYKQAAARLGILPRQLQSITWEGIRSLFKDKSPELQSAVRDIWKEHQNGDISIDDARKRIVEVAGGFKPTDWQSDFESDENAQPSGNAPAVSGTGVSEEEPPADSGRRGGTPAPVSAAGARPEALEAAYKAVAGLRKR